MSNQQWRITDRAVIDALQKNGFRVEHPQPKLIPGAVPLHTRQPDEDKDWYVTDCPIARNGAYTLASGQVIQSRGTELFLIESPQG